MSFIGSPAGRNFTDSFHEQYKKIIDSIQKECINLSDFLQGQDIESYKQKCGIIKKKAEAIKKLRNEIMSEFGYENEECKIITNTNNYDDLVI
jgi:endonuclease III